MPAIEKVLDGWRSRPVAEETVSTTFSELERMTGRFRAGRVWVVTGAPGEGRSTLLTQWALHLARSGWTTELVAPHDGADLVLARLLSAAGRLPLHRLQAQGVPDEDLAPVAQELARLPLEVALAGDLSLLNCELHPLPRALLVDDVHRTVASPERMRSLADRGTCVVVSLPKHEVVVESRGRRSLSPAWTGVADVVLEVQLATWPDDAFTPRPGEADFVVLRSRYGPTGRIGVLLQSHYAHFVPMGDTCALPQRR